LRRDGSFDVVGSALGAQTEYEINITLFMHTQKIFLLSWLRMQQRHIREPKKPLGFKEFQGVRESVASERMPGPQVVLRVSFVVDDPNLQVNPSHPKKAIERIGYLRIAIKRPRKRTSKKRKRMDSHCFLVDFLLSLR
jgi:hypothetical protein